MGGVRSLLTAILIKSVSNQETAVLILENKTRLRHVNFSRDNCRQLPLERNKASLNESIVSTDYISMVCGSCVCVNLSERNMEEAVRRRCAWSKCSDVRPLNQ